MSWEAPPLQLASFRFEECLRDLHKAKWFGLAEALARGNDKDLIKFGAEILKWLQDMNWPGAETILARYSAIPSNDLSLLRSTMIAQAIAVQDAEWEANLRLLPGPPQANSDH